MLQLRVYYHDVLRYTIHANLDKVQELRDKGFNVQVEEARIQELGLGGWRPPRSLSVNGRGYVHNSDGFGVHKLAEERPEVEYHTLGFD